jgi:hypothetical protein
MPQASNFEPVDTFSKAFGVMPLETTSTSYVLPSYKDRQPVDAFI